MRTLLLILACALLLSCTHDNPPAPVHFRIGPLGTGDDSSPIIISDGSIQITHAKKKSHFRVHSPKHAVLKLGGYELTVLGFGCDPASGATVNACNPSSGPAVATCATSGVNMTACQVNVDPAVPTSATTWTLAMCDSGAPCSAAMPPVSMAWDNSGDLERIDVKSTPDLTVAGDETNGPALRYPTNSLASARLTVNGTTNYDFNLTGTIRVLKVAYECRASGNNSCK